MQSLVQKFYANKVIFVTGGTGFLGQVLVEKLLRSCPEVKTIYILMRGKNNSKTSEWKSEYFENSLFDVVRQNPSNFDKIYCVKGDMELPLLGLSEKNIALIESEVNIVFHSAATVIFDELLSKAVKINLQGTKQVISLCKRMHNLKAFVHVSTAFTNANRVNIDEKIYPTSEVMQWETLLTCELLDQDQRSIIKGWPNTYTFTKYSSEIMLNDLKEGLPIAIVRPAAVSGCVFEPERGWIGNHHGINRVLLDIYLKKSSIIFLPSGSTALITPVDICVNNMVVSAWELNHNYNMSNQIKIYNCLPLEKLITWGDIFWKFTINANKKNPEESVSGILVSNNEHFFQLLHPKYNFYHTVKFVGSQSWHYSGSNLQSLWKKMPADDRKLFPINFNEINWENYCIDCYEGIKHYVISRKMNLKPKVLSKI